MQPLAKASATDVPHVAFTFLVMELNLLLFENFVVVKRIEEVMIELMTAIKILVDPNNSSRLRVEGGVLMAG